MNYYILIFFFKFSCCYHTHRNKKVSLGHAVDFRTYDYPSSNSQVLHKPVQNINLSVKFFCSYNIVSFIDD